MCLDMNLIDLLIHVKIPQIHFVYMYMQYPC